MGELEHGRVGLIHTWGQHGHPDGESTHVPPGSTPDSLGLEPVLDGGPGPISYPVVDNNVNNGDCVTKATVVAVAGNTRGSPQPSYPMRCRMRCPSRQAMDIPYTTMVSSTKQIEHHCKKHFLTRVGEETAHIHLAMLLLWESFDSVQRCWMS
jgi:hypothetical protein